MDEDRADTGPHVEPIGPTQKGESDVNYRALFQGVEQGAAARERAGYRDGLREGTDLFSRRLERAEEDASDARILAKLACLAVLIIAIALASRPPTEVPR